MPATIRVLCVDDHRLMREGIARIVGVQPDLTVVAEASDGEQAVEQFIRWQPDVTLMDLEMPRMNGVQAIQAIRSQYPNARIVARALRRRIRANLAERCFSPRVPEARRREPSIPQTARPSSHAAVETAGLLPR